MLRGGANYTARRAAPFSANEGEDAIGLDSHLANSDLSLLGERGLSR